MRTTKSSHQVSPHSQRLGAIRTVFSAMAAAAVLVGASACKKEAPAAPPAPTVQIVEIVPTDVARSRELIGQLDSPQNVEVRARVEGFVDKKLFTDGTQVKEGDPLFVLDKKPFEQRLAAAQGMLAEAQATMNKAQKDVARLKPLAEKRAIPRQDLDNAEAAVAVTAAAIETAEASLAAAKIDLGYCEIKAPVGGLIGTAEASIGELVGKGEPTLLATISVLDPIWFYCTISEAQFLTAEAELARTNKDISSLPLTLSLANNSVHPESGQFGFIDRAVDAKTGTMRLRAVFPNPKLTLRPGMFGRIIVDIGASKDSILVPQRAVTEMQGKHFVWVVGSDMTTTQRSVKVGDTIEGNIIILEGLAGGDRVITEGIQKAREGGLVQAVSAPAPKADESNPEGK